MKKAMQWEEKNIKQISERRKKSEKSIQVSQNLVKVFTQIINMQICEGFTII